MDLDDQDYYDSDGATSEYYNNVENNDDNDELEVLKTRTANKKNYTVLSEADIRQRQAENIDTVSSFLSLTNNAASILLRHHRWCPTATNDAWFTDEDAVRKSVGLLFPTPVVQYPNNERIKCRICYEKKSIDKFSAISCNHLFCVECWTQYLATSIDSGPGCLTIRCPDLPCRMAVPQDMIYQLVSNADKEKYNNFLVRSFVESNARIKWCPAPGCKYAIDYDGIGGKVERESHDVFCLCSKSFCWNCGEDTHRPVDCDTVGQWISKNKSEAENTAWILAYTKPCPKCKRSIEKNEGCMHMTCKAPCNFEFCWLCLGSWVGHSGFYDCNHYRKSKLEGSFDEEESRREMAKKTVERYTHYYERWAANEKSIIKAAEDLFKMENENLEKLKEIHSIPVIHLEFIMRAWVQIIECRRVLKWTYAYGYYIPEEDETKKTFFEYLQGEAEAGLERLHHCSETELRPFLVADKPSDGFFDFGVKLINLIGVTETYFKNLVNALEDGLSEVDAV